MYSLREIMKGVITSFEFTPMKTATNYQQDLSMSSTFNTESPFEDDIISIVDTGNLLMRLNHRKRYVFIGRCLGFENWQLAEMLKFNERTIERDFRAAKNILKKMSAVE